MRTRLYALPCPPGSSVLGVSCFNQLDHVETMARMCIVYLFVIVTFNLPTNVMKNITMTKDVLVFFFFFLMTQGHHGLTDGQTKEYRDVNDLSGHAVIQWSNHVHDY